MNKKYKILWVDDEVELFTPFIKILEKKNYNIETINNGHDAIEIVKIKNFDLILLDVMMPGIDGIEVLKILKTIKPYLPVVMITKSEDELTVDESIAYQVDDYLVKPIHPRQLLAVCKKILKKDELIESFNASRYAKESTIVRNLFENDDFNSWIDIAIRLNRWSQDLSKSNDLALIEIHSEMRKEANINFKYFLQKQYPEWLASKNSPLLPHNFFDRIITPLIENEKKILWIIIDCMRMDQWLEISKFLKKQILHTTDYFCSHIPSATPFSRNGFFAGLTSRDIIRKYPELTKIFDELPQNRFEKDFLLTKFRNFSSYPDKHIVYRKILNIQNEKSVLKEFPTFTNKKLVVLVIDFIDMLSHSIKREPLLDEMIQNEISLKNITSTWFINSPIYKVLSQAIDKQMSIVITTDHGSIKVKSPAIMKNARGYVSPNLRYKHGSAITISKKHRDRVLNINDPESYGLYKHSPNTNFLISVHDSFLVYPTNPEQYSREYINTFQHGGISLEEMIIPYSIINS